MRQSSELRLRMASRLPSWKNSALRPEIPSVAEAMPPFPKSSNDLRWRIPRTHLVIQNAEKSWGLKYLRQANAAAQTAKRPSRDG